MSGDLQWNDAALYDMLHSMDGPVGRWLMEKSLEMTAIATALAPVQSPKNFSWGARSSSYMPRSMGYLKGNIRPHMGYTKSGQLYSGTNAPYGPTLFLEQPAEQLHHKIPFMSSALYAVVIG